MITKLTIIASCYILKVLSSPYWQQEGGMNMILAFLLSIIAGVVAYYICKWLDGKDSGN